MVHLQWHVQNHIKNNTFVSVFRPRSTCMCRASGQKLRAPQHTEPCWVSTNVCYFRYFSSGHAFTYSYNTIPLCQNSSLFYDPSLYHLPFICVSFFSQSSSQNKCFIHPEKRHYPITKSPNHMN